MTMAIARDGCIATASRPIDTVGSPSPITPLMKPASSKAAAMKSRRGSNIRTTLTDRSPWHNLEVTELAFGYDEGRGKTHPHPEQWPLGRVSKDEDTGLMVRDGARAPPHHEGYAKPHAFRPDRPS